MALTPEEVAEQPTVEPDNSTQPSRTWALDFEAGRIRGVTNGEPALRQFVIKTLKTERYRHVIYTDDYGNELQTLIGADMSDDLLKSEVPRMVREALIYDDRVEDVAVEFRREGDKLFIAATVTPASGNIFTEEVTANV